MRATYGFGLVATALWVFGAAETWAALSSAVAEPSSPGGDSARAGLETTSSAFCSGAAARDVLAHEEQEPGYRQDQHDAGRDQVEQSVLDIALGLLAAAQEAGMRIGISVSA